MAHPQPPTPVLAAGAGPGGGGRRRRVAGLLVSAGLLLAACGGTAASATPSGGGGAGAASGAGGGQAGGGNGGDSAGASPASATPQPSPSPSPSPTPTPSPSPSPASAVGPYAVKQTQTLGGEAISGTVCDVTKPFSVSYATPKVAFVTAYMPISGTKGTLTYAYSIASAGESHDATGTYTVSGPAKDGVLHVTESVKDHVVFKGFDGKVPIRYSFDLVPAAVAGCPGG